MSDMACDVRGARSRNHRLDSLRLRGRAAFISGEWRGGGVRLEPLGVVANPDRQAKTVQQLADFSQARGLVLQGFPLAEED